MADLRPAILRLKHRGEPARWLFFASHEDALDTAIAFGKAGWTWEMIKPEMYQPGEHPADTPLQQLELGEGG